MPVVDYQISRSLFGRIIGPGGSTIKSIQGECGVTVSLSKEGNTVTVAGDDDAVAAAAQKLEDLLGFAPSTDPIVTAQFDIEKSLYGRIIGSHGATLKELESKSGCNVDIPRRGSDEEYVTAEGTEAGINALIEAFNELLGEPVKVVGRETAAVEVAATFDLDAEGDISEALFFPEPEGVDNNLTRFITYLRSAKRTLDICIFTVTNDLITSAILFAHNSGVQVRIVTDDECSAQPGSDVHRMKEAGIPVVVDNSPFHMHHKFAVIDGVVLVNGSFNWTRGAAENNCENIVISNNSKLVSGFHGEFERLWAKFN